jgi:hypothetical protein
MPAAASTVAAVEGFRLRLAAVRTPWVRSGCPPWVPAPWFPHPLRVTTYREPYRLPGHSDGFGVGPVASSELDAPAVTEGAEVVAALAGPELAVPSDHFPGEWFHA